MSRKIPDVIAAVDLGSNSFHMVVARYSHGQLIIMDRLREMVRLAAGLDDHGRLDRAAMERALACLQRFGQRLRDMRAESVRVVGTNTLRRARRKSAFLERAREALGHPIDIISGIEEARLIYAGVVNTMPSEPGRRLVADIGGGSTEIIIGEGANTKQLDSLYMGCVTMSSAYFPDGEVTEKRMRRARLAARVELEPLQASSKRLGWEHAIGTSGTIRTVSDIVRARHAGDGTLTPQAVEELVELAIRTGSTSKLKLEGLSEERAPVFPGGIAILAEVMSMLDIRSLRVADGALREGLLYDLLGRLTDEDARMRSVRAMQARYHAELTQAERVEAIAIKFLEALKQEWKLDEPLAELVLRWAARLHEIGLDVSHSHYHRHSAYLIENADMPGFPQEEQRLLARVVGVHRRKLHLESLEDLTPPWHIKAEYLIVLFRLAVVLHRGRSSAPLPGIIVTAKGRSLDLEFPKHWLEEHPLTQADLEQEIEYLRPIGFKLRVT